MPHSKESQAPTSDTESMEQLRALVLGENGQHVTHTLKTHARDLVGDVVTEALYDREKQDGSVNNVLVPLVEKSVQKSVANHSEQFVGYLYPLVGSLVRKSVTAFITELLEKTNTLLENSLTIKGLKWRFKAWQAGVSFSQYAASQTFAFRVEQVFLIHRETGLLLKAVSSGLDASADADMVSSMLTAINDFVSDSFKPNADSSEQTLDVVRTDDFSLILKQGPKAFVVASVKGNVPQSLANQLQDTLEQIHKLYDKELDQFEGDAVPFEHSENQLKDCLISELKQQDQASSRKPWLAWLLVVVCLLCVSFAAIERWQTSKVMEQLSKLDQEPGIMVTYLDTAGLNDIELHILRDPSAVKVEDWLTKHDIHLPSLRYRERAYLSLDHQLIRQKTENIVRNYPDIKLSWDDLLPRFSGQLTNINKLRLQGELSKLIGLGFQNAWLDGIAITGSENNAAEDPAIIKAILDLNIAKIDRQSIAFEPNKSNLSDQAVNTLIDIKQQFNQMIQVAEQLKLSLGLIVMGTSDTSGNTTFNKILSQKRADNVKAKLQELGIAENRLNAIGLGVIDLEANREGTRKVLFNVVYFDGN